MEWVAVIHYLKDTVFISRGDFAVIHCCSNSLGSDIFISEKFIAMRSFRGTIIILIKTYSHPFF